MGPLIKSSMNKPLSPTTKSDCKKKAMIKVLTTTLDTVASKQNESTITKDPEFVYKLKDTEHTDTDIYYTLSSDFINLRVFRNGVESKDEAVNLKRITRAYMAVFIENCGTKLSHDELSRLVGKKIACWYPDKKITDNGVHEAFRYYTGGKGTHKNGKTSRKILLPIYSLLQRIRAWCDGEIWLSKRFVTTIVK